MSDTTAEKPARETPAQIARRLVKPLPRLNKVLVQYRIAAEIEAVRQAAYQRGQEAMREAAETLVRQEANRCSKAGRHNEASEYDDLADRVSALPTVREGEAHE